MQLQVIAAEDVAWCEDNIGGLRRAEPDLGELQKGRGNKELHHSGCVLLPRLPKELLCITIFISLGISKVTLCTTIPLPCLVGTDPRSYWLCL